VTLGYRFDQGRYPKKWEMTFKNTHRLQGCVSWGIQVSRYPGIQVSRLGPAIIYKSMPCWQSTPSQPNGRPGVGCPQGKFCIFFFGPPLENGHESLPHLQKHFKVSWGEKEISNEENDVFLACFCQFQNLALCMYVRPYISDILNKLNIELWNKDG
jgi:hypothetical protein